MSQASSVRILVIEDEQEIREFLVLQFGEHGMTARGLSSGEGFLSQLEAFEPHVVVLDQMMPGKSGTELIKELRASLRFCETPVMMLTGLDSEAEKVAALEIGADDYVTKPFSVKEVVARIQALVRRSTAAHKSTQKMMSIQGLTIDLVAHRVMMDDCPIALTLTEFKILVELMRQSGQVLTRDRLRERALGNLNVTDRTIDVHMASLRKKLDSMGDHIETVRGVGYRLAITHN